MQQVCPPPHVLAACDINLASAKCRSTMNDTEVHPQHDPKLLNKSIEYANKFYSYDSKLEPADRRRLGSYFSTRMFLAPVFSIPVACGFIMLPNVLKRRNIFFNPQKRYFFTQVFLGFTGLGVGQNLGAGVISVYQRRKLQDNETALGAYNTLSIFPSQLGSQYFRASAQNEHFKMKDPSTIDWSKNPLFPLYLVVNKDLISEVHNVREEQYETYRKHQIEQREQAIASRAGPPPTELTGTSWDKIIELNEKPKPNSGIDAPQDDFSDSEKKW